MMEAQFSCFQKYIFLSDRFTIVNPRYKCTDPYEFNSDDDISSSYEVLFDNFDNDLCSDFELSPKRPRIH